MVKIGQGGIKIELRLSLKDLLVRKVQTSFHVCKKFQPIAVLTNGEIWAG